MSIIEKVFHYEENEVSVIEIDGEIWFKARDVSLTLGHVNVCKSISDVDPEDRIALGQLKKGVTKRKLPFVREFKRWIVKDVLPNIRKNEKYCLSNAKQCFSRQLCFKIMDERDIHLRSFLTFAITIQMLSYLLVLANCRTIQLNKLKHIRKAI